VQTSRQKGFAKEQEAAKALQKAGYSIVGANFYTKYGEIDIIANHENTIVFVEVKYRDSALCGLPQEAVTFSKQNKIIKTAMEYIKLNNAYDKNYRFDVVAISKGKDGDKIEIIKNAFEMPEGKYYI
jgi:putative endonuclease